MGKKAKAKQARKTKRAKKLFKYEIPELQEYVGRDVIIDGKTIRIEQIVGNVGLTLGRAPKDQRPQYLEINGKYNISMLRFFAQMEGATDITEDQFKQFEETEFWAEANKPTADEMKVKQIIDNALKAGKQDGSSS